MPQTLPTETASDHEWGSVTMQVGDVVEDFGAVDQHGATVRLADLRV